VQKVDDSSATLPALDLASTVVLVRPGVETDRLDGPRALGRWLDARVEVLGPVGPDTALRLADFRSLRDAIRSLFEATVSGGPLPPDAVRRVNAASAAVPTCPVLETSDPCAPSVRVAGGTGNRSVEILAEIARSAIAIVGGPGRERLRRCPAPRCGRFLLGGRRGSVWCSPACGNRARVARHHARARAGAGPRPAATA
jgi:predicted RNA-binding Zn ribbon-like protein